MTQFTAANGYFLWAARLETSPVMTSIAVTIGEAPSTHRTDATVLSSTKPTTAPIQYTLGTNTVKTFQVSICMTTEEYFISDIVRTDCCRLVRLRPMAQNSFRERTPTPDRAKLTVRCASTGYYKTVIVSKNVSKNGRSDRHHRQ
jgi:hypothetical protein